jgi:hypothetical protein
MDPDNNNNNLVPSKSMTQKTYHDSPELDEETEKSGFNSNFQLPPFILKNLTPIKKKKGASHDQGNWRRDQQLESRINGLKERSALIETRLQNLRLQRTLLMNDRIRSVQKNHKSATSRRNEYLELVKARAKRFTTRRDPTEMTKCGWVYQERIEEQSKGELLESATQASPQFSNEEVVECLRKVRESRYLDRLEASSFREARILTCSPYNSNVKVILSHLMEYHPTWSHFFYAFVMIADFKDSIGRNFKHPGFNTNVENVKENYVNNFIWVLLYKCSKELIGEFRKVITTGELKGLEFLKAWDDYFFMFKIFKQIHFNNLNKILVQAISIIQNQMELVDEDLQPQLKRLQCEKALLWTYNRPPVQDQRTATFIENLEYRIDELFLPQNFEAPKLWDRNVINYGTTFVYDNVVFRMPALNYVLAMEWRVYWFGKFRNLQTREAPKIMQTGHCRSLSRPKHDTNEFLKEMNYQDKNPFNSLYEQDEVDQMKNLGHILSKLTENVLEYISAKSPKRLAESRRIDFIVSCLSKESNKDSWILLLTDYLQELVSIFDGDLVAQLPQKCLEGIYLNNDQSQMILLENLQEIDAIVANWWLQKCGFADLESFQQFENVYVYINAKNFANLRPGIFTNSPALVFPKFHSSLTGFLLKNYLNMVEGSYSRPKIFNTTPDPKAFKFFNTYFNNLVIKGDFKLNELNQLYINHLKKLHYKLKNIVEANTCVLLIKNYYPNLNSQTLFSSMYEMWNQIDEELDFKHNIDDELISLTIQASFHKFLNTPDIQPFLKYYFSSRHQISTLTLKKVANLMTIEDENHFNSYATSIFGSSAHIKPLMDEASTLNKFIYNLYQPILNWIYIDLGKPMDM